MHTATRLHIPSEYIRNLSGYDRLDFIAMLAFLLIWFAGGNILLHRYRLRRKNHADAAWIPPLRTISTREWISLASMVLTLVFLLLRLAG